MVCFGCDAAGAREVKRAALELTARRWPSFLRGEEHEKTVADSVENRGVNEAEATVGDEEGDEAHGGLIYQILVLGGGAAF